MTSEIERSDAPRRARVAGLALAFMAVAALMYAHLRARPLTLEAVESAIRLKFPDVRQLSTTELAAWLADPGRTAPVLLDARAPEEFAVSTLPHARRASGEDDLAAVRRSVRKETPIVVYCSVGYRSSALASRLTKEGFEHVFNLEGSIFAWANEGRPLVRPGPPETEAHEVHPYDETWGALLDPRLRARVPPR